MFINIVLRIRCDNLILVRSFVILQIKNKDVLN